MNLKELTLLLIDERANFEKKDTQSRIGKELYTDVKLIETKEDFDREYALLEPTQKFCLVCHVFHAGENGEGELRGFQNLLNTNIEEEYGIKAELVSAGDSGDVMRNIYNQLKVQRTVYLYYTLRDQLKLDKIDVYTKQQLSQSSAIVSMQEVAFQNNAPQADYVIITALEEDEMEKVLPMIKKEGRIQDNRKHLIEYGTLKSNPSKRIAYASQISTGMVDASILATEMIIRFQPKFVIMTGVLGGKPEDTAIGDVVVSTKVFTIDKGKISNGRLIKEIESSNINSAEIASFKREKDNIRSYINAQDGTRTKVPNIHFEPVVCVRQVINMPGYFKKKISTVERKAIALEMESYGIARACELVNNGTATPLIIKSVMDNTMNKVDDAKHYAAWTSAMFAKYILENDLI